MTPMGPPPSHPPPPPPTSLTNDNTAGPQMIGDWGWVIKMSHSSTEKRKKDVQDFCYPIGVSKHWSASHNSTYFFGFLSRKVRPPSSHYNTLMQQPLLTNQMPALSAHQPINIGIAHVVWPQTTAKRNRHGHNRWCCCAALSYLKRGGFLPVAGLNKLHLFRLCVVWNGHDLAAASASVKNGKYFPCVDKISSHIKFLFSFKMA